MHCDSTWHYAKLPWSFVPKQVYIYNIKICISAFFPINLVKLKITIKVRFNLGLEVDLIWDRGSIYYSHICICTRVFFFP